MKDPTAFELTSMMVHDSGFVCYDYRAKNSFGATMPNSAVLTNGAKLLVRERDSSQFVKAWNANCTKPGASDQTDLAINILKRMS